MGPGSEGGGAGGGASGAGGAGGGTGKTAETNLCYFFYSLEVVFFKMFCYV